MQNNNNTQELNVMDILLYLLSKWKWFLLSTLVCVGLAWFQYARTPQTFFRSSTVIIKDPSNKTVSAGLDRYDNYINKVNVSNEILQFKSRKLLTEVVTRTRADVSYKVKAGFRMKELYTGSPVTVSFLDATPDSYVAISLTPKDDSLVVIQNVSGDVTEDTYHVRIYDNAVVAGLTTPCCKLRLKKKCAGPAFGKQRRYCGQDEPHRDEGNLSGQHQRGQRLLLG